MGEGGAEGGEGLQGSVGHVARAVQQKRLGMKSEPVSNHPSGFI